MRYLEVDFSREIFFENHFFLKEAVAADTDFLCLLIHGVGDGDIGIGQTDGIEIDKFVITLSAGLFAGENINQVAVDKIVGDQAVFIHPADSLGTMLDCLPIVADELICHFYHGVFVFPATDMAIEGTLLDGCWWR